MIVETRQNHTSRILVVEDDSEMRALLNDELSDEGYEVIQAGDAAEAAVRVSRESFDLVITDMKMPKLGGLELLPVVKEACPDLPVIVITAFADGPTLVEAYVKGAFCYISKPFKIMELKNEVRKALQKKGGE